MLILPEAGVKGAEAIGSRLGEALRKIKFDFLDKSVTISVGIASYPQHEDKSMIRVAVASCLSPC